MDRFVVVFIAFVSLIFTANIAVAQDANAEFIRKFSDVPQKHHVRFYTNRKLTIINKYYEIKLDDRSKATATIFDDCDVTKTFGGETNMIAIVTATRVIPEKIDKAFFRNKDIYFSLERSGRSFALDQFCSRSEGEYHFLINFNHTTYPASMFNGVQSIELMCNTLNDQSRLAGRFVITSITKSSWKGKPALCVRSTTISAKPDHKSGVTKDRSSFEENFFDESNGLAYLGTVAKNEAGMNFPIASVRTHELEYHMFPGEDYPLPKRFTRTIKFEGQESLLQYDTTFTSNVKYVPDPEEFKLEKKYGLTTPVGPEGRSLIGKPGFSTGGRSWTWIYLLAAGVLLAGFVVYFVRKRRLKA